MISLVWGLYLTLSRLYVVVPVIDLHLFPCNNRTIGFTLQVLGKNFYTKGQTKAQHKQNKKHSKIIPIRLLSFFAKKHEGIAIYKNLLPSLLIKPFKSLFILLRRRLNLEVKAEE
jgi:hypothetical protein